MGKKKYDPLWEILKEKAPLQGVHEDVDARCPSCHVVLHVGAAEPGGKAECGLCGTKVEVALEDGRVTLRQADG